jgi:DnaJ-class molecular chaperone
MICPVCHGNGFRTRTYNEGNGIVCETTPCPACIGGPNAASCCEGDQPSDHDKNMEQDE